MGVREPIQIHVPIISDKQLDCPYEKPFGYIYLVTNKRNGHMYVGQHSYSHPYLDKDYHGSGIALFKAYEKYGIENFSITILQWINTNKQDLNESEVYWIDMFSTFKFPQHYNLTPGGDGFGSNEDHPFKDKNLGELYIEKIRQKATGRIMSEEQKQKFSEMYKGEGNPFYNHTHTPEAIRKQSINHPDVKGKNNPNFENYWSDEQKINRSLQDKIIVTEEDFKNLTPLKTRKCGRKPKPVVQLEVDGTYVHTYEYANQVRQLKFKSENVISCCKGHSVVYAGYKWMYLSDYLKLQM